MSLRADKISLSDALYTGLKQSKNSVKSVIKTAIKEQKSANELAKMLFEGYDFKADPLKVKTKYPKYLWEKSAKTKVKNIKTPALRAAYSKILKDESKLVADRALKIAGYEKARYYAKRIALNETARAYNDARAFEYSSSKDIQVVKIQMSKTHPRTDICDYYASVDKYGLGAGVYPKDKAPVPPFHPFCRCQMIPRYSHEYAKPKLNANADKEDLEGLKEWQRARILGSKDKANEALKTGDINSVFNAMKPERYKVKSIDEVAEFQKQNDIIPPLNQGQNMQINEKASNFLKELCADIDFSKAGYRPPLKEPLILARFDDEIINKLKDLGYKLESNELKVSTQKQLFHGMRRSKIQEKRALSKADFLEMPLKITFENMYVGLNRKRAKEIRFFWDITNNSVKYVYFSLDGNIWSYGITKLSKINESIKVKR